jgi:hypothetical protein
MGLSLSMKIRSPSEQESNRTCTNIVCSACYCIGGGDYA